MEQRQYVNFLNIIEKLKCNTRHSWTSNGRHESVAEHSWRLAVMALLCKDEYPDINIDKVIKMALIHDLGEAVTGDVPAFYKTNADELNETNAIQSLLNNLPSEFQNEFSQLFNEMSTLSSPEAKLLKALDNLEAVISHNEADLDTWIPLEYTENLTYGGKNCEWSAWTKRLRAIVKEDSIKKINTKNNDKNQ